MRSLSRLKASLFFILCGAGIALPPVLLLLVSYAVCLTDPARPDYYSRKIQRMFCFPDPGVLTWPALCGVLFGIGIAVIGGLRAFVRNREGR